ncbi:MAG: WbqC family protein [Dehalococcoidales bacterium]|nr:WbqC family protein [Dehalococcoidales bacterium]
MKVVLLQPGYLPWLGFFDQMYQSDIFIIYDDVQYDKHGWRNRNRIKTAQGVQWLTIPVLTTGRDKPLIKEVMINNTVDWRQSHLKTVQQSYSRAPFFSLYFRIFEEIYTREWQYLIDIDMAFISILMEKLDLTREIKFSSALGIKGQGTERIVNICHNLGADSYLTGDAAKDYLDEELFSMSDIKLQYHNYQHPVYNQLYGAFVPYLSVIDLLFNHGGDSLDIITHKKLVEEAA